MALVKNCVFLVLLLFLSSCGYLGVKTDNKLVADLSKKYQNQQLSKEKEDAYIKKFSLWYKSFNNTELDNLIDAALKNNLDLAKAMYNLQAAAYQLGDQRSALVPTLSAQTQGSHQEYSKKASNALGVSKNDTLLTIGLAASYELDIWGKNYAAYRGAKTKLKATATEVDAANITAAASMMNLWVNLMTLRQEKIILADELQNAKNLLELQRSNYITGAISITDLLQQENQVLVIDNKLKDIKYEEADTLRSINILIGKEPLNKLEIKSNDLPELSPLPSKDLNVMVLANRPDVQGAFYNMIASEWDVKVANLSRLPSFTIEPQINWGSDKFTTLFDHWLANLVISGTMPLFAAGAMYDKEQAAKALNKASVVNYKQVVFNAINEFKGALDNETKYQEGINNLNQQIKLLEETQKQLRNKYLNGEASYIEFLTASNQVNELKLSVVEQQKEILLNRVLLYRTLGIAAETKEEQNDKA